MKLLCDMTDLEYDGYFVRRPKIMLLVDDSSGLNFISGHANNNSFYQLLAKRRHIGIFAAVINIHSITLLFG